MKYPVILCLLLAPFFALAQSNYHKGSITDNQNQTVSGYINYREWDESPKYVEFKNSLDDNKTQSFYPSAIKSFVVDEADTYYSYTGKISQNRTRLPDLPTDRDTTTKTRTVFLKLITTGDKLTLYEYTDSIKTRYFIQEKNSQPVELLYQQYYNESKTETHTVNTYAGQLSSLIVKYNDADVKLLAKTERLTYSADLEDIVNDINGVKAVVKKRTKSNVRFFVGAGATTTTASFDVSNDPTQFNKSTGYSPKISAGIDIFSNPDIQSFIFRAEVYANYNSAQFLGNTYGGSTETYSFKQYIVGIAPQFIYNIYNKDAFKVYIDAGVMFSYSSNTALDFSIQGGGYPVQTVDVSLIKLWYAFPIQVGVVLNKRLELFASGTVGTVGGAIFTNDAYFNIKGQIYSAGVHYLFK
jgi:hypothetical protein